VKTISKIILVAFVIFCISTNINADEQQQTLTEISFSQDDEGNLNPDIFIPIYYTDSKSLYSGIGYSSSNKKDIKKLDSFSNSKNALVSSTKKLSINYISYQGSILFFGIKSEFIDAKNSEFGYIHDSDNLFENGTDYYISYDNDIELDIKRHGIAMGAKFNIVDSILPSRFSSNIYPYTSIGVKQKTIFKPLVKETGTSSSSSLQDLSYDLKYEIYTNFNSWIDFGVAAQYSYQPIKYDIAQLKKVDNSYKFIKNEIDEVVTTKVYTAKIIFNKKILGGLNPYVGVSKTYTATKDRKKDKTTYSNKKLVLVGIEKKF
jgi:hypothetical protein